ncbi:hypothetical protein ABIA26_005070 [Sinorhizobium fredii]
MGNMFQKRSKRGGHKGPLPSHFAELLDVDLGASVFELLLEVSSFRLGNGFLDSLRSAFDEVLGFLEAEAGDGADFLDDVDLVRAGIRQDDVELGLFFFSRSSSASSATSSSNCYRSSSRNAPLFFEQLWKAQQLPGRSARRGLQRSLRDQPFYFSFCSVRTGFRYNSENPPQAASSFLA